MDNNSLDIHIIYCMRLLQIILLQPILICLIHNNLLLGVFYFDSNPFCHFNFQINLMDIYIDLKLDTFQKCSRAWGHWAAKKFLQWSAIIIYFRYSSSYNSCNPDYKQFHIRLPDECAINTIDFSGTQFGNCKIRWRIQW